MGGLYYTKWMLITSVVATMTCGVWWDKSAPYFPIEISRTATGKVSCRVFQVGVTLSTFMLYFESETSTPFVPWLGLLLLAWVDDITSWSIHMLGVLIMALGTTRMIYMYHPPANITIIVCCAILWVARLFLKICVVFGLEYGFHLLSPSLWLNFLLNRSNMRTHMLQYVKRVMYTGETIHPFTLTIFKTTGVMQWMVFWFMSTVY